MFCMTVGVGVGGWGGEEEESKGFTNNQLRPFEVIVFSSYYAAKWIMNYKKYLLN